MRVKFPVHHHVARHHTPTAPFSSLVILTGKGDGDIAFAMTVAGESRVWPQMLAPGWQGLKAIHMTTIDRRSRPSSCVAFASPGKSPQNIHNGPTKLMKDIGYGKGYAYDHDADDGFSGDNYWPQEMEPQAFYRPVNRGFEAKVA